MTLYINGVFEKDFIINFLPKVINGRIKRTLRKKNLKPMNREFKLLYGINVNDVLNSLQYSLSKSGDVYTLNINNNILEKKSGAKISTLVKLLDYGNLDVKGLDIVNSSFKYIEMNFEPLYRIYTLKKLNERR